MEKNRFSRFKKNRFRIQRKRKNFTSCIIFKKCYKSREVTNKDNMKIKKNDYATKTHSPPNWKNKTIPSLTLDAWVTNQIPEKRTDLIEIRKNHTNKNLNYIQTFYVNIDASFIPHLLNLKNDGNHSHKMLPDHKNPLTILQNNKPHIINKIKSNY